MSQYKRRKKIREERQQSKSQVKYSYPWIAVGVIGQITVFILWLMVSEVTLVVESINKQPLQPNLWVTSGTGRSPSA